jgi:diaminopimelate decarboxylase
MIKQFATVRPGGEVILRINPGFGHGHSRKTDTGGPSSKHGIWHEQLPECLCIAREAGVRVVGLHMHIGSGADFHHLSKVGDSMAKVCEQVEDLRVISAGGGLPTPYRPDDVRIDLDHYQQVWDAHCQLIEKHLGRSLAFEIEPGRYPVAESGWLVSEIRAIKKTPTFTFYLVDSGFNHLVRPAMYGSYHPMSVAPRDDREMVNTEEVVIAGPLCESGDVFTQEEGGVVVSRELPTARVGDFLTIHCTGAYGRAMASNYNSHPLPAEVWLDGNTSELITPRQTYDEVIGRETIPANL